MAGKGFMNKWDEVRATLINKLFNKSRWLIITSFILCCLNGYANPPEWIITKLDNPAPGYLKFDYPYLPFFFLMDNYALKQYQDINNVKYYSMDFKLLSNGNWGFLGDNYLYIMSQDMAIVDSIPFIPDCIIDPHDFLLLSNGHYLMMYQEEVPMNLSNVVNGGNPNAIVLCNYLIETDRSGTVYWRWDAKNHVDIRDITPDIDLTDNVIDFTHLNSLAEDKDGNIIVSFRNLDELTKINKSTGKIVWRMGGTKCKNNQFQFINDLAQNYTGFSHQHSINLLSNGNLLIFDNGNMKDPQYSRVVEYELNQTAKTVKKVWEYRNTPDVFTDAMGSVQRLSGGNTLINWGDNHIIEVRKDKSLAFEMIANPEYIGLKPQQYKVYKYVTKMNAVTRKIEKPGAYDFNETNNQTGIVIDIGSMNGTSDASVEKHNYKPADAFYKDTNFADVFPYRWVFSHYGLTGIKGVLKIKASTIANLVSPAKAAIYKRNSENNGTFEPLPTVYNAASGYITAEFNELGEFVLCSNILSVPNLAYPADKAESANISTDYIWSPVQGAAKYQIQLARAQDFTGTLINRTIDKVYYWSYDSLLYNTTYYWKVRALNPKDTSNWSNVRSFSTIQVPQVKLSYPLNNYNNYSVKDTLGWAKVPGTVLYRLQVSPNEAFDTYILDSAKLNKSNFYFPILKPGIKYYWRVMAYQGNNMGNWSEIRYFTTKPSSPSPLFPPNDSINLPRQGYVSWTSINNAKEYIVQISDKPEFSTKIVNTATNTPRYNYSLIGGKWYYWRSRAVIAANDSTDWSVTQRFNAKVRGPELRYPSNYKIINQDSVYFGWDSLGINAVYRIQISYDDSFNSILIDSSNNIKNYISFILPLNKTFYWRVSGIIGKQLSEWSSFRIFYTGKDSILSAPSVSVPSYYSYYDVDGKIKWKEVAGAVSYRLQLSASNEFTRPITDTVIKSAAEYNYSNLKYNSNYYIRLKSLSSTDSSVWSQTARLRTYWNFVGLLYPEDDELMVRTQGTFTWNKPLKADFYELFVSTGPEFADTILYVSNIKDTVYNYQGLKKNTLYYWRVRNVTGTDTSFWSFYYHFYTESENKLSSPVLVSPKNNQNKIPTDLVLQWEKVPDAAYYRVMLSRSNSFELFNYERDSIAETTCKFTGLRNNRYYYWKVSAYNSTSMSIWSQTGSFLTELKQPSLIFPANDAIDVPLDVILRWTKSSDSVNYNVILSLDPDFGNILIDENIYHDTTDSYLLKSNIKYYWKVSAWTNDNGSRWSSVGSFTTLNRLDAFDNPDDAGIAIGPVPAGEILTIYMHGADGSSFRIYSSLGAKVLEGVLENKSIYIGSLASGIYYLRINGSVYKFLKL